ncbi:hypothetical protein QR680_011702 [Steinernema hermaphroditum]|uniref:Peptidase S1 domain-containing protein n=1 Tax=Steinernema hermaphroditum TaxID=289476 RepID=A0AA39I0Y8_9BILA|nr:hypothetical protein QR680_011702 [Steinernema hermaphroditum]
MGLTSLFLLAILPLLVSSKSLQTSELIYNGNVVTGPVYPFQLYLRVDRMDLKGSCGATLLSTRYALTAAHCAKFMGTGSATRVYGGVYDTNEPNLYAQGTQNSGVLNSYIHPEYNATEGTNDIAVLELDIFMFETDTVQYVKIAANDPQAEQAGADLRIIGYGKVAYNNGQLTPSPLLHAAKVKIVNRETCKQIWWKHNEASITDRDVCTDATRSGTLNGDSGGALAYRRYNPATRMYEWLQLGVISGGIRGRRDIPDVHSRAPSYCDWIKATTRSAFSCI